ncbi:HAD family hydrolase [Paenibacillus aquistagni]|uniref:HAD family hydrolase n=1 Tax=Paenibacillus aquistagni TaxID=1852522 RepID=UPI00145A1B55|nr:HAD family hydrolase [Paenibacillus aquistagni]NMM53337.1 HAD family phosphatase [Paenibacillus aquistagni]
MTIKPYDLIVCDLDGTLLDQHKRLSEFTIRTIKCITSFVPVILATARAPRDIEAYMEQLELTGPIICYNGAMVYSFKDKLPLVTFDLELEACMALVHDLRHQTFVSNILVEQQNQFWVDSMDEDVQMWVDMGCEPHAIGYPTSFFDKKISKIMAKGDCEQIIRHVYQHYDGLRHMYSDSKRTWVEFIHCDAGKERALEWLLGDMGISKEKTIAFGDADNDLPLLQTAGCGVAMGNAADEVKQFADLVIGTNEDSSVARYLDHIFKLEMGVE